MAQESSHSPYPILLLVKTRLSLAYLAPSTASTVILLNSEVRAIAQLLLAFAEV